MRLQDLKVANCIWSVFSGYDHEHEAAGRRRIELKSGPVLRCSCLRRFLIYLVAANGTNLKLKMAVRSIVAREHWPRN